LTVSTPLALLFCLPPLTLPSPGATANLSPPDALPISFASFTITDGGVLTAVPAVADWLVALFAAIVAAVPAVPVAVNVTGLPDNVPEEAVRVFDPAVGLSVHEVRAAIPSAPVLTGLVGVTVPLPAAGVNVTATPVTGSPFYSFTLPDALPISAVPAVADWLVGLFAAIVAAVPAVPVAVNVTGLPESDPDAAVSVFGPAVGLSVQEVRAGTAAHPVVPQAVFVIVRLPAAGENVTAPPVTAFPCASF